MMQQSQSKRSNANKRKFKDQHASQFLPVKDNSLRSVALTKNNSSMRSTDSKSVLSPHNSVFQALQNPDLDLELSSYSPRLAPMNDASQQLPAYTNNDFSITSWQSISSQLPAPVASHGQSSSDRTPFSNPFGPPPLVSGESTTPKNVTFNFLSNTRNMSPNIGSILSSSDNDDRLLDELSFVVENPASIHNVMVFDSESEDLNATDDEEYTVDSSTIIPSFVMPRVSIPSLGGQPDDATLHPADDGIIKVQVVGSCNQLLVQRLNSYKKTLKNVEFYTSNQLDPHLLLLLVNRENYLLPTLINKPYIPIIIEEGGLNADDILNRLVKGLMICEPIVLKSINDDVVTLIDFLDNLERMDNFQDAIREFLGGPMASSMKLNTVNSIMMEKSSSSSGFVGRRGSSTSKSTIRKKARSSSAVVFESDEERFKNSKYNNNKKKNSKDISSLKAKLILGITFGVISLTVVMVWRELSAEFIDSPKFPIGGSITPKLSTTVSSSVPPSSSYVPKSGATQSYPNGVVFYLMNRSF
ncbi:unnamed protein product [Ambrosiozyma monospora]|uniref:Unnamed protein product n=1 Tax=Ambrosiozyma monospora TaxID=43982 RepID=A0A9W7DD89_AMBMO|nr:unnamed protein product [Ambrosiozyma monospora]